MRRTRREFLTSSLALTSAPSILKGQTRSDELRVAFIGVGNRGSFLLRQMLKVPGVRVVAVCDLDEERARKAAQLVADSGGSARVWTDYRRMLDEQKEIDAVVQAVYDWAHKDVNLTVLEMGKHLYAEKPLALTIEDCRMTVRAARQAKGIMQVGFQLRYDPNRNASMKFIHSGGIGRVLLCHGMRHGGDLPRDIPWYFDREKSGDILIDQGIHILDLFTWAIGKHPVRAMGSGGTNLFVNEPPGRTVMDNYSLILEYPDGQRVNFSHHYFDPPRFTGIKERVFGSEGAIDLAEAVWQPRTERQAQKLDVPNAGQDATYMALAAFVDCVRNQAKPLTDVEAAFVATAQAIMGTRAIYERRIVSWDEVVKEA